MATQAANPPIRTTRAEIASPAFSSAQALSTGADGCLPIQSRHLPAACGSNRLRIERARVSITTARWENIKIVPFGVSFRPANGRSSRCSAWRIVLGRCPK